MNRAARTADLAPGARNHSAAPQAAAVPVESAAISLRLSVPGSGSSAISVRAVLGPALGTLMAKSSFARQAGVPRPGSR